MSFTLADIFPRVAARLNDVAQTNFTNTVMLPYAQDACDELQNELQLFGIPILEKTDTSVTVAAGTKNLGTDLPTDLLVPQRVSERLAGTIDMFLPMTRREWEPEILPTDSLRYWSWREQDIFFVGATTDREIKLFYLKLLLDADDEDYEVVVFNSRQFLICRIAEHAARFIGENSTRADELKDQAGMHLNKLSRIGVKSKQGTRTRRRPFMLQGRRR